MAISRGFRSDPSLDLLEESAWELAVRLDEAQYLSDTVLVSIGFGGWVTLIQPPWREDAGGSKQDRAKRSIGVGELIDAVPARFGPWVLETTAEALASLDDLAAEGDEALGIDDAAGLLAGVRRLREELVDGEARLAELHARGRRVYGDLYLYDFPPEMDLEWDCGTVDGLPALLVSPLESRAASPERALLPPDAVTPWRWTEPSRAADHRHLLPPAEARSRVPVEFRGWVEDMTHAALLEARRVLKQLSRSALSGADDLAQLARVASHAQELASLGGGGTRRTGASPDVADEDPLAEVQTPDGRTVRLFPRTWGHIVAGHPELDSELDLVMEALANPDRREPDPRAGRERFFRRSGPERWLRVVVEFAGPVDRVVTAFPQSNDPEEWNL